jgi:hypothetical protein
MRLGTKSVLFGYHQFILHPLFVAEGWRRLYGFPWDPRLWAAFFLHDVGYLGKPNMDGPEGERHPELGADIMAMLFDGAHEKLSDYKWRNFCITHSRTYAHLQFMEISPLCFADKLAFLMYPVWLLKALYWASGEFEEYRRRRYSNTEKVPVAPMSWEEWHHQAWVSNAGTLAKNGFTDKIPPARYGG